MKIETLQIHYILKYVVMLMFYWLEYKVSGSTVKKCFGQLNYCLKFVIRV